MSKKNQKRTEEEISMQAQDHQSLLNPETRESGSGSFSQNKQVIKRLSVRQSVAAQMDFDTALEKVGSEHWYQKRAFLFFAFQWFVAANILLCGSFLFPSVEQYQCPDGLWSKDSDYKLQQCKDYTCSIKLNDDKESDNYYKNYLEFATNNDHYSFTEYQGLYCNHQYLNTMIQSIPYLGSFLGFLLFPMIADNKGRKLALILSWVTCTVGCLIMVCSWTYWPMLLGYFLSGFGCNPAITLHYSFFNEHSTGKLRQYTAIGVQFAYGIGELFMVLQVYEIHNWRLVCLVMLFIPSLILNSTYFFIYESPKYVYEQSTELAFNILNNIAKINKKEPIKLNALQSMVKDKEEKTYSIIDLFRYKSLRIQTICSCIIFFAIQAVYYGISFSISSIGYDIYKNTLIIAIAEVLAYGVTDIFIPKLRRKTTVMIGFGVDVLFSLSFLFINGESDGQKIAQLIIAALMRFNIAFVWTVVYVFLSELYPTTVRSLAMGFTSLAGTIGSFGAPYLVQICDSINLQPMVALGVLALIGIGNVIPLKETYGQPLKQQIDELDRGVQDKLMVEYEEDELLQDELIMKA